MAKDYYNTLGVDKKASADDIKSAYRRLAKKYHPDVYATKSDAEKKTAETKFKEIQHAYEVLSNPDKKAAFDQFGDENGPQFSGAQGGGGFNPFGDGGGFGDIFSDFFGSFSGTSRSSASSYNRPGDNIEVSLDLTFEEAVFGTEKEINIARTARCPRCNGTGAKDSSSYKTCPKCGGVGSINVTQRTIFGAMQTRQTCPDCGGSGKIITSPCPECGGNGRVKVKKPVRIKVPAGIDTGNMITMQNEGHAGRGKGANGNLFIVCRVAPSNLYVRKGYDVYLDYPISIFDAMLGAKLDIPGLYGKLTLNVEEGTYTGKMQRYAGKGIKKCNRDGYGDFYVKVIVDIPKNLSSKQKKQLEELRANLGSIRQDRIDDYNKKVGSLKR